MREIECQGMGHPACLLHGKPEAEWPGLDDAETNAVPLDPAVSRHQDKHFVAGVSAGFNAVRNLVERTARTDASLLFLGETGVGKEVFAKLAHRLSLRNDAPFVALNCAAIPEGLIEAELFGVAKGAFTGAGADRPGRFELADGGTLFLDEISMLSPLAQSKVLRAIHRIQCLGWPGGGEGRCRTTRNDSFGSGSKYAKRHGRAVESFTECSINMLLLHDYPGNIREPERMVERAVLLADEFGAIDLHHLFVGTNNVHVRRGLMLTCDGRVAEEQPVAGEPSSISHLVGLLRQNGASLATIEEAVVRSAIDAAEGNVAQAARELGLTRRQLSYKVEKMQSCD